MSLNETLAALGYTTEPGGNGKRRVFRDGKFMTSGTAAHVWHWLRSRGEHTEPCPAVVTIYILEVCVEYEGNDVIGAFSSVAAAKAWAAEHHGVPSWDDYSLRISEMNLDNPAAHGSVHKRHARRDGEGALYFTDWSEQ